MRVAAIETDPGYRVDFTMFEVHVNGKRVPAEAIFVVDDEAGFYSVQSKNDKGELLLNRDGSVRLSNVYPSGKLTVVCWNPEHHPEDWQWVNGRWVFLPQPA